MENGSKPSIHYTSNPALQWPPPIRLGGWILVLPGLNANPKPAANVQGGESWGAGECDRN